MTTALFKIVPTGTTEWWGAGVMQSEPVIRIGPNFLLIKEGFTKEDVVNSTISLVKATTKEQKAYAAEVERALNPEPTPDPEAEESSTSVEEP